MFTTWTVAWLTMLRNHLRFPWSSHLKARADWSTVLAILRKRAPLSVHEPPKLLPMAFLINVQESTVSLLIGFYILILMLVLRAVNISKLFILLYTLFFVLFVLMQWYRKTKFIVITPGSDIYLSLYPTAQIFSQLIHGINPYAFEKKSCPNAPAAVLIRNKSKFNWRFKILFGL